jgi:preprotein translocase subunit SecA
VIQEDAQAAYTRRETEEYTPEQMRDAERRVVLAVLDTKWREHLYEMDYLREGIGLRAMAQRDPLVEYQREGYDMFNVMMDAIKEDSVGHLLNTKFEFQDPPIVEEVQDDAPVPGMLYGPQATQARPQRQPAQPQPGQQPAPGGKQPGRHAAQQRRQQPAAAQPPAQPAAAVPAAFGPRRPTKMQYSAPSDTGGVEVTKTADPYANVGRNDPCPCGSGRKYKRCHGGVSAG